MNGVAAVMLRALTDNPLGVTAGELAVTYGLDRTVVARILDRLTRAGATRIIVAGRYAARPGQDLGAALAAACHGEQA